MLALPSNTTAAVETNVINNIARIVYQQTAITANQHRDLENLVTLLINRAVLLED